MITAININGTPLDLSDVELEVAIDHGRNDITQAPQASTCQIIVRSTSGLPLEISDLVEVTAYGADRFTGTVTDIQLSHEWSPSGAYTARMQVTAMGRLAQLGLSRVGAAGYIEETLEDRVTDILTEAGYTYTANVQPYMVLLAEDPSPARSALEVLSELCFSTGATMCDLPDGNILFESYTRRGVGYNPATFAKVTDPFSAVTYIWSDVYEATSAAPTPVALPNGGVVWEPIWNNSVLTIVNEATVTYGDPEAELTETDAPSIATHGLRSAYLNTRLADATDAFDRVQHIIATQSEPRYDLAQIQILVSELDNATRTQVLGLVQGSRVQLSNLPQPAPSTGYLGVLEGWSESYSLAGHILTLSLSDPRYSYAMATWAEVSASLTWATTNATVQWYDVVLPSDLLAA